MESNGLYEKNRFINHRHRRKEEQDKVIEYVFNKIMAEIYQI